MTSQTPVEVMQVAACAVTVAALVNEPRRPNTNPATDKAAMTVTAMSRIVARIGEMAPLLLPRCRAFIVGLSLSSLLIDARGIQIQFSGQIADTK